MGYLMIRILGFPYHKGTIEENRNLPSDVLYYPLAMAYTRGGSIVFLPQGETVEIVEAKIQKWQGNQTKFTNLQVRK